MFDIRRELKRENTWNIEVWIQRTCCSLDLISWNAAVLVFAEHTKTLLSFKLKWIVLCVYGQTVSFCELCVFVICVLSCMCLLSFSLSPSAHLVAKLQVQLSAPLLHNLAELLSIGPSSNNLLPFDFLQITKYLAKYWIFGRKRKKLDKSNIFENQGTLWSKDLKSAYIKI